jgi:hypothetical protein
MIPNRSYGAAVVPAQFDRAKSSSVVVMKGWSLTSVPPTCLQGVDRENFIFIYRILVGMLQIRRPLRKNTT